MILKLILRKLEAIWKATKGKVQMVLHGTSEFTPEIMRECIKHDMTRVNVSELVLSNYSAYTAQATGKVPDRVHGKWDNAYTGVD